MFNMEYSSMEDVVTHVPDEFINELLEIRKTHGEMQVEKLAFVYSFCVVSACLCEGGLYFPSVDSTPISRETIVRALGGKNYTTPQAKFIKKGGILEQAGLVFTSKEIPLGSFSTLYDSADTTVSHKELLFATELQNDPIQAEYLGFKKPNFINYSVVVPQFLMKRRDYSRGTLSSYVDTYEISLNDIIRIIEANEETKRNIKMEIYTFGILKLFNNGRYKGFKVSGKTVEEMGLMKQSLFSKYTRLLKAHGLIKVWQQFKEKEVGYETNIYHFI